MAKWGSTCNHNYLYRWLPCQYFILLMMGAWRPKHVEKVCSNKICILLHHVSVLFNPIYFCLLCIFFLCLKNSWRKLWVFICPWSFLQPFKSILLATQVQPRAVTMVFVVYKMTVTQDFSSFLQFSPVSTTFPYSHFINYHQYHIILAMGSTVT